MPVPEIDRLAHEILDILGDDALSPEQPDGSGSVQDRARVAIAAELREVDPARKPLLRYLAESLQPTHFRPQPGSAVWHDSASEFQRRPVPTLLRLYAALERAEMQERATPTPNLDADQETALPLRGRPDNDMSRHQEGS